MKQKSHTTDAPGNDLSVGRQLEHFEIEQITPLPELRATAILATHVAPAGSGAIFMENGVTRLAADGRS